MCAEIANGSPILRLGLAGIVLAVSVGLTVTVGGRPPGGGGGGGGGGMPSPSEGFGLCDWRNGESDVGSGCALGVASPVTTSGCSAMLTNAPPSGAPVSEAMAMALNVSASLMAAVLREALSFGPGSALLALLVASLLVLSFPPNALFSFSSLALVRLAASASIASPMVAA